jgi:hypothetical protein
MRRTALITGAGLATLLLTSGCADVSTPTATDAASMSPAPSAAPSIYPPAPAAPSLPEPSYPAPLPPSAPVFVPPVTTGDAVDVLVQPPCPSGKLAVSIEDVEAQPTLYQQTYDDSVEYELAISGVVDNRTDAAVRLDSFDPVTVKVDSHKVDSPHVFPLTIRPGRSVRWKTTARWRQETQNDRPRVTADALRWKWDSDIYANCRAGPFF